MIILNYNILMMGTYMRVCLVSPEVFSWGYYGGFGFLTRVLGRELTRRGYEVSVVTVKRHGQREIEELDGIKVYGFPSHDDKPHTLRALLSRLESMDYYKKVEAEIYHSQAISYNTFAAQRAMPHSIHLVTFQDPYDLHEWRKISQVDEKYQFTPTFRLRIIVENRLLSQACKRADGLYSQAKFLIPKAKRLFGLKESPTFLPNPIYIPDRSIRKSDSPLVCFLARWDPQKRVELFLRLAKELPDIDFIAMGRSNDPRTDALIRKRYTDLPNLTLTGFVSEEEKSRILERSWLLVNTSIREALPVSFLEALAHETPILSGENPDSITKCYGYHVKGDNYSAGLRYLLRYERWRELGRLGREYVEKVHKADKVLDMHVEVYRSYLEARR